MDTSHNQLSNDSSQPYPRQRRNPAKRVLRIQGASRPRPSAVHVVECELVKGGRLGILSAALNQRLTKRDRYATRVKHTDFHWFCQLTLNLYLSTALTFTSCASLKASKTSWGVCSSLRHSDSNIVYLKRFCVCGCIIWA